ncbi:MAG: hypothetical protein HQL70_09125 [Magnetococcales bacterium]|nr:hypothetical protein [Magnetococcales bacterium]
MAEETGNEESAEKAESPAAAKQPSKILPFVFLAILIGGLGFAFVYMDEKVQINIKKLDRVWADKQVDLVGMARQRMYDTSQSHLQTEMMDRWRQDPYTQGDKPVK